MHVIMKMFMKSLIYSSNVCKSAVVLRCINLQFCYVIFSVISMAFDRCSINDYLLTYLLSVAYEMDNSGSTKSNSSNQSNW